MKIRPSLSPQEVALALKFAHAKGCWDAVSEVISEIEKYYGELPISKLFPPELIELAQARGLTTEQLFREMLAELREEREREAILNGDLEKTNLSSYLFEGTVIPEA